MNAMLHTPATIRRDTGLTDDELRAADARTRRWYLRVLTLMNDTGCSIALAVALHWRCKPLKPMRKDARMLTIDRDQERRLLIAEIMEAESCNWIDAAARVKNEYADLLAVDADTPAPQPARFGWSFVAWCLLLALLVSLVANGVFVAVLAGWV